MKRICRRRMVTHPVGRCALNRIHREKTWQQPTILCCNILQQRLVAGEDGNPLSINSLFGDGCQFVIFIQGQLVSEHPNQVKEHLHQSTAYMVLTLVPAKIETKMIFDRLLCSYCMVQLWAPGYFSWLRCNSLLRSLKFGNPFLGTYLMFAKKYKRVPDDPPVPQFFLSRASIFFTRGPVLKPRSFFHTTFFFSFRFS